MKNFIKHKYFKRLLDLSKYKKHKRLRSNLFIKAKRFDFYSGINYNRYKQQYIIKKNRFKHWNSTHINEISNIKTDYKEQSSKDNKISINFDKNKFTKSQLILKRKKYTINSYLSQIILRLSRKFDYHFLGKEIFRHYYTSPFRLTTTRFLINKMVRGYYKNLSKKALINIKKNISNPSLKFNNSLKEIDAQSFNKWGEKKEVSKYLVLNLENRLNTSLLRLLNFRSNYTCLRRRKLSQNKIKNQFPKFQTKSLWGNYNALQIKQFLSHGHIYVNNKKLTYGNRKLLLLDTINIKGIIPSYNTKSLPLSLKESHKSTILLRRLKDQKYLNEIEKFDHQYSLNNKKDNKILYEYIRNLKIKRFTEIFYITYRNMHLIKRNIIEKDNKYIQVNIEKQILPIFEGIGYNQSIFLLWPITSLLKISVWSSNLNQNFIDTKWPNLFTPSKNNNLSGNQLRLTKQKFTNFLNRKNIEKKKFSKSVDNVKLPSILLPNHIQTLTKYNPSIMYSKSLRCYASITYGIKLCKWVQLQQSRKSKFYNNIYNKNQFFDLELKFFQLIYQYYNG